MYNKAIKLKYIDTVIDNRIKQNTINVFESISEFENKIDTDIANADLNQVKYIIDSMAFQSYYNRSRKLILLEKYVDYTIECKIFNQQINYITFLKNNANNELNGLSAIYKKYFKSPVQAIESIIQCFGKPEVNVQFINHIAYVCLAYCGLSKSKILKATRNDIDFDNNCVMGNMIYPEMWAAIINSLNTTMKIGRGQIGYNVPVLLTDYIIKNDYKDFNKIFQHDLAVCKARLKQKNETYIDFSFKTAEKSGRWYRAYCNEQNGIEPNISKIEKPDYINYKKAFWE